jgi:hypothetical protein
VFFAKAFYALQVELYPVACVEGRACRLAGLRRFLEEVLESSRGDDLQDAARSVASVPEGMPLVAGFEDQGPHIRVHESTRIQGLPLPSRCHTQIDA